MKPQKRNLTTENTEEKIFKYKNSVPPVVFLSQNEFPLKHITEQIISCAIEVHWGRE